MSKSIDYYLSLISPWSYLGHERLQKMAKEYGTEIKVHPVDLSIIFPATGGIPLPKRSLQRIEYRMQELIRWRDHLKLPLTLNPRHFPVRDRQAAIMVVNLREQDPAAATDLAGALLRAVWVEQRDISDQETLLTIARENNQDGNELLSNPARCENTIAKDTEEAVSRGIFGAPSYVYRDQIYWGQDRLDFLYRSLAR
ncbi:MAG: 2-hydroxychromene-2-carboxylate isomerase [Gammaproteobacteria bacterium]|nr:2-hydroxychromene-2-carboxylate isomerase [Gammaproteobacteria bacterium]